MSDGIKIAANIYRPQKAGKFPVVMAATPYSKDGDPITQGARMITGSLGRDESSIGRLPVSLLTPFEGPDPAYWVSNGYAVVVVDVRGTGKSEGKASLPGIGGAAGPIDIRDIIDWAGTREWSNGNVGMSGVSALCMVQYYAEVAHPVHLKAIIPWEGVSDNYSDTAFPGGIPETIFGHPSRPPGLTLEEAVKSGAFDNVKHQTMLSLAAKLEEITVPALVCGSWSDQGLHTRGSFQAFRRISSKEKWLYTHGGKKWEEYYCDDALAYQKKFFDYYLKGVDNGWKATPAVRLEIRDTQTTYTVRSENEWPIARTDYKKLYLNPNGALSVNKISQEGKVSYDSNSGAAVFDITFDKDTELSGYMKLQVSVAAAETDDMDLIVGVHKLDANKNEVYFYGMNGFIRGVVARGWLRVSQRELDAPLSTPWQPVYKFSGERKIKPGEINQVEIAILPSSTIFRKGETLRLAISGKDTINYGRVKYEVLLNKGAHTIYAGGKYDSYLQIPVVPAK
jgi:predicted acyl esterase